MYQLGKYNKLTIHRSVDFGVYLIDDEGNEVLLPAKQVPQNAKVGDELEVFVYTDSQDRPISTVNTPKVVVDEIACLRVVDTTPHGAFLDWGLEKDLFLPFKHQPKDKRVKKGEQVAVKVLHDPVSDRLIATTRVVKPYIAAKGNLNPGSIVKVLIRSFHERGFIVIVNDKFPGMLYSSEVFEDLSIGDIKTGYVKNIREDGKIDITLKPMGFKKAVKDDKSLILERLEVSEERFLPYNAKSSAEDIQATFNLSRKAFKKALGALYKERKIQITEDGMKLV